MLLTSYPRWHEAWAHQAVGVPSCLGSGGALVSARMPCVIICIRRTGALALALLLSVGLPLLRMAHEAEHQQHEQHQVQNLLSQPGGSAVLAVSSASDDDECGPCAICQLLMVVAGQHAVPVVAQSLPPPPLPEVASTMSFVEGWWPSAWCLQPPARGPPLAVIPVEPSSHTA